MHFTSRHSGYTRPAHETCSEGEGSASSEESQQLSCSPLTSDASEQTDPPTPLGSSNTGNTSRTERLRNQMVLVERAPEPLPSSQSIPLRRVLTWCHHPMSPAPTLLRPGHPMSPASVLWTPVLLPATPPPIDACNWLTASTRK